MKFASRDNFVDLRDSNYSQYGTESRLYKIAVSGFRFFLPVDIRIYEPIQRNGGGCKGAKVVARV